MKDEKTKKEIQIAAEENALEKGVMNLGELTPFACPECHGVLSKIKEGTLARYRCHTGHAYSTDTFLPLYQKKLKTVYIVLSAVWMKLLCCLIISAIIMLK